MTLRDLHAFTLPEVLIGLVLFGIFAATVLPTLSSIDKLDSTGRAQGRTAAAVPLQEQLIARGLDPASNDITAGDAMHFLRATAPKLTRTAWIDRPGRVSVWRIQGQAETAGRMEAFGYQLGAGTNDVTRGPIVQPLPPIVLGAPVWSPAGPVLDVALVNLPPAVPNDPWRIRITVTSDPASRVKMRFYGPTILSADGLGSAVIELTADDLAAGAPMEAWSEYNGTASDYSEVLSDGRARWWASTTSTLQLYEPSDKITRTFKVDVGAPMLTLAGNDYPSGSAVPVDWNARAATAITGAKIHYPDSVAAKFRFPTWVENYAVAFDGQSGADSGVVTDFFGDDKLGYWADTNLLTATMTSGRAGIVSSGGQWNLDIASIALAPPELSAPTYDTDYYNDDTYTLTVPLLDGARVGRVAAGDYESTGPTLTLPASSEP